MRILLDDWLAREFNHEFTRHQKYRMVKTGILKDVAIKVGVDWFVPNTFTTDPEIQTNIDQQREEEDLINAVKRAV